MIPTVSNLSLSLLLIGHLDTARLTPFTKCDYFQGNQGQLILYMDASLTSSENSMDIMGNIDRTPGVGGQRLQLICGRAFCQTIT